MTHKPFTRLIGALAAVAMLAGIPALSYAQGYGRGDSGYDKDWEFHITPYGWLSKRSGTIEANGLTAKFNKSWDEAWDRPDGGANLDMEFTRDGFGVFVDGTFLNMYKKKDFTVSSVPGRSYLLEAMGDAGLIFNLINQTEEGNRKMWLSLTAGGRYDWTRSKIKFDDPAVAAAAGLSAEYKKDRSYAYPIAGARLGMDLTDSVFLMAKGNYGGFDIGKTKYAWDAVGFLGFRITRNVAILLGYQGLGYKRKNDSADEKAKLTSHGPAAGLDFRF